MIQVAARNWHDDSIKECRIHDLLRDVVIEKAKEDNFLMVCSTLDGLRSCGGARRVAVHNTNCNKLMKYGNSNPRTLLFFKSQISGYFGHGLLKVLSEMSPVDAVKSDQTDMPFEELCPVDTVKSDQREMSFEESSQLRFLKFTGKMIMWNQRSFVKSIRGMKLLQTLYLEGMDSLSSTELSDCIWHIKTLRHVEIYGSHITIPPSTADLPNLQTLLGVRNHESWEYTNLPNLPNLRQLKIRITGEAPWGLVAAFLHTLKKLVMLEIRGQDIPTEVVDMKEFPFYPQLTQLTYRGRLSCPAFDVAIFPTHLVHLELYHSKLPQDSLTLLEKLLELKVLILVDWTYTNLIIKCSAGGFPSLQKLDISLYMTEWEIEKDAMRMLKHLSVHDREHYCSLLEIPQGLQHLTALTNLRWCFNKHDLWSGQKAKKIRNFCKHVPSIYFDGLHEEFHPDNYFNFVPDGS
jgi:hypothetical protein